MQVFSHLFFEFSINSPSNPFSALFLRQEKLTASINGEIRSEKRKKRSKSFAKPFHSASRKRKTRVDDPCICPLSLLDREFKFRRVFSFFLNEKTHFGGMNQRHERQTFNLSLQFTRESSWTSSTHNERGI